MSLLEALIELSIDDCFHLGIDCDRLFLLRRVLNSFLDIDLNTLVHECVYILVIV